MTHVCGAVMASLAVSSSQLDVCTRACTIIDGQALDNKRALCPRRLHNTSGALDRSSWAMHPPLDHSPTLIRYSVGVHTPAFHYQQILSGCACTNKQAPAHSSTLFRYLVGVHALTHPLSTETQPTLPLSVAVHAPAHTSTLFRHSVGVHAPAHSSAHSLIDSAHNTTPGVHRR
jgi:hypothetical protein